MKIKFLGTSAGWPLPRLGHHCELCDSTDPKDKRLRSSVLVNENILIDAGADTYQKLLTIDSTKIKFVILTHWHPDHTLGVWDLTHIYKEGSKLKPLILGTSPTLKYVNSFLNQLQELKIQQIEFGQTMHLEGVDFSNFEVKHTQGTFGVKLIEKDKTFVYIPDFKFVPEINLKYLENSDLLVMDGSSLAKSSETLSHQSIETGLELAKKVKPKQVSFTHLGHKSATYVKLQKFVADAGGENFFIPYDGMEVVI